jgi:4-hydroxy-2-oxoheptanedioate aldolase
MTLPPLVALAARLRQGPPVFVAWAGSREPANLEVMLRAGCDGAVLDWQHSTADAAAMAEGIQVAQACGKAALVRVGLEDIGEAARFLDWGAAGVIVPMVSTPADARRCVSALKYAPLGERSYGPVRAAGMAGLTSAEYFAAANGFALLFVMIETKAAMENLEAILAVEGVDGVLVGPNDLCIALTEGAVVDPLHPLVDAGLTTILAAAKKAGKLAAAFCPSGARAGELAKRGYHLVSIPTEQMLIRQATLEALATAREVAGR